MTSPGLFAGQHGRDVHRLWLVAARRSECHSDLPFTAGGDVHQLHLSAARRPNGSLLLIEDDHGVSGNFGMPLHIRQVGIVANAGHLTAQIRQGR